MRAAVSVLVAVFLALIPAPGRLSAQTAVPPAGPRTDYVAEFKVQGYGGPRVRGRAYGAPGKERREIADIWGGTTLILRYDLGLVWTLIAGRPFYTEAPLSVPPAAGAPGLVFRENDDINDVPASRYDYQAPPGGVGGEIWLTEDGIALRIDGSPWPGAPEIRFELDKLVRAPQNPALFEIPPGYRKSPEPPRPEMAQPAR